MPRLGPFVIFGITFLVWITAKGELGKYWGFATTPNQKQPASGSPSDLGGLLPPNGANAAGATSSGQIVGPFDPRIWHGGLD